MSDAGFFIACKRAGTGPEQSNYRVWWADPANETAFYWATLAPDGRSLPEGSFILRQSNLAEGDEGYFPQQVVSPSSPAVAEKVASIRAQLVDGVLAAQAYDATFLQREDERRRMQIAIGMLIAQALANEVATLRDVDEASEAADLLAEALARMDPFQIARLGAAMVTAVQQIAAKKEDGKIEPAEPEA